jgi:hypothetical protein
LTSVTCERFTHPPQVKFLQQSSTTLHHHLSFKLQDQKLKTSTILHKSGKLVTSLHFTSQNPKAKKLKTTPALHKCGKLVTQAHFTSQKRKTKSRCSSFKLIFLGASSPVDLWTHPHSQKRAHRRISVLTVLITLHIYFGNPLSLQHPFFLSCMLLHEQT